MERTFLEKIHALTNGVTPNKEKNEAMVILARDSRAIASIDGNISDIANMIYQTAKENPQFAEILELVVDKLNEECES